MENISFLDLLEKLPRGLPLNRGYVEIKLEISAETVRKVEEILQIVQITNRANVVAGSINTLHKMIKCVEGGGEVKLDYANGETIKFEL